MNFSNLDDMPLGFGMALAQDVEAMKQFSKLPVNKQKEIISKTRNVNSRQEMQAYVQQLRDHDFSL
ncbi:MAG: hypothetical protein GX988_03925 [Clostridiales bacterium]|nr:hypothetical protein [Clostridiales bacterium]